MVLHKALSTQKKQPGVSDAVLLQGGSSANTKGSSQHLNLSKEQLSNIVSEDDFLLNLESRFKEDVIYTYIGDVVVSVNPFKTLDGMFGNEAVKMYRGRYYYEVPPHIFAMTDDAYRDMLTKNRDQCVIISGESGAGKTEASKLIMQYIASVSSSSEDVDRVKDILLKSNPILEAFGNAKTNKNNNSSRFGKYMDIQFNFKGDPVGGQINNYLLEKSRVVHQAIGERSFHIMYYLLNSRLEYLKLGTSAENYTYLKSSGCFKVNGIDDKKEFDIINAAMKTIGFNTDDIQSIFKTVAGILHLGNVEFKPSETKEGSAEIAAKNSLAIASQLFGVSEFDLQEALLMRSVVTQKESVKTPQSVEQASYARDAFSKALYFRLFDSIVSKINEQIKYDAELSKVIGVLDIYGFEVFETGNGFEQFCINYCNEKLQQLFISLTLKQEQEEYAREGIEWTHIEYFNNAIILELIESTKNGLIATLDEECLRPGNTNDQSFLEKINQRHAGPQKSSASEFFESKVTNRNDKTLNLEQFRLKHYAGNVTYDIQGFMDKNMDNLSRDIKSLLYKSKVKVISSLFPDGTTSQESSKRMVTTATTFKTSLNELVNTLLTKVPHYVRCIKSNSKQIPGIFDMELCRHQTRYLGLLENVRVRRAGFVFRQPYEKFLERYRVLCHKVWPKYRGPAREGTDVLLKFLQVPSDGYRLGKTKVFIRKPNTLFEMEEKREEALPRCAVLIQKIWKGYRDRQVYKRRLAVRKIVHFVKKYKSRKFFMDLQKSYANVKSRPDLGKIIPWPRTNVKALQTGSNMLKQIFKQWRSEQIIMRLDPAEREKIRAKVTAHGLLGGKKPVNLNRPFLGEYLNKAPSPYVQKYEVFKSKKISSEKVLFSDVVQKSNRNGKGYLRLLIVSDKNIYLLHPDFTSKKPARSVFDIRQVSVFAGKDFLVVLQMNDGYDFILDLTPGSLQMGEKVSELLVNLFMLFKKQGKLLRVVIENGALDAKTLSGQFKVQVEKGNVQPNGNAIFKSQGRLIRAVYSEV